MAAAVLAVGSVVEGVVTGTTRFGAFVDLGDGKTGLVHISEVADVYVQEVSDFVRQGDQVRVKVLSLDPNGKVGLSIKQADPSYQRGRPRNRAVGSFEDRLTKFLRESEEKQADYRRATDSKRGGRGGRRQ